MYTDTISAIATALGEGGIGIIRLSGPHSKTILHNIFRNPSGKQRVNFESHRLYYGTVFDPEATAADTLDEVMAVYLAAPRTYTCEDMVELNCHGGMVGLERVLNLTLRQGARQAEPGEFTLRAFLNGRIDLAQSEAVLDIVRSKTGPGLEQALSQLAGNLSRRISNIRQGLLSSLAHLEAMIDFPEDDVPPASVINKLQDTLDELTALLATADAGLIYRHGIRAAIVGVPNVGKSSLLNALLRSDRAIVTPIAGTTRDIIEETVNIRGVPVVLVDTAGITSTEDVVEQMGIERSRQALSKADLLLLVLDGSRPLQQGDFDLIEILKSEFREHREKKICLIINKVDISPQVLTPDDLQQLLPGFAVTEVSAHTGEKLDDLEEKLARLALGGQNLAGRSLIVTNERHKHALEKAKENLEAAIESSASLLPADFISIDLRLAMEALGEITGESVHDSLLKEIFTNFCIGK